VEHPGRWSEADLSESRLLMQIDSGLVAGIRQVGTAARRPGNAFAGRRPGARGRLICSL